MADLTPARKSGRQPVPNKKYANDAVEILPLVIASDEEDEGILQLQHDKLVEDDSDEFRSDALSRNEDEEGEDEDDDHDGDSLAGDSSDGSAIQTPVEEYEDAHSYASTDPGSPGVPTTVSRKTEDHRPGRDPNTRSRGMPENPVRHGNMMSVTRVLTGTGIEDILHVVEARDKWGADPTLPRRVNLCHGLCHTDEKRQMEATVGWDWYYDQGGCETLAQRQNLHTLTTDEAYKYSGPHLAEQDFLMGPYGSQKRFQLPLSQGLPLDRAWDSPAAKRRRHGWMLNVGTHVRCMDWVPNRERQVQYLALTIAKPRGPPSELPPAFTPAPVPSAIQIWSFPHIDPTTDQEKTLESSESPALRMLLCTEWGEVNQLKWCPVPRTGRKTQPFADSLGLLAAVFSDGSARVLDVQIDQSESAVASVQAYKYRSAAFEVNPLDGNLSTCLTWLSASDLAVGFSDGHLAIYNIYPEEISEKADVPNGNTPQEPSAGHNPNPSPWLELPLHSTYIIALNSAYPSHPSLLLSSSLSGYLRLTSLVAPTTDYVFSSRTRAPPTSLAYCDALLSAVGPEESSETIKVWGLRCFYTSFHCGQLPAPPGPGNCIMDVGKCHPTTAVGCTDGSVIVTNPMRKILHKKQASYQQCIFKHEWRPDPKSAADGESAVDDTGKRHGLSRITEGYKLEAVNMRQKQFLRKMKQNEPTTTIHEEETAVTALAWNPNVSCGGWLAVGWGSGLVRVEDVAID